MRFGESQFDSASSLLLADGEIHLWLAFIPAFTARIKELEAVLSREEIRRMQRYYFPKDRARLAVSYGILRIIMGRYLNIFPHLLTFRRGAAGKPELQGFQNLPAFSFNISHSHELVVFAFSKFRRLGVDVEHIRPMPDFPEIMNCNFHPYEIAALQGIPLYERQQAFFYYWTGKEAFVKATGEGLSRSLASFFISLNHEQEEGIISVGYDGIRAENWVLRTFRPDPDYVGTVAFEI